MSCSKSYIFLALILATVTSASASTTSAEKLISDKNVTIIDGNNLIIKGKSITLYAIKAPDLGTPCNGKKQKYDCGKIARSSLMDLSAGAKISCSTAPAPYSKNRYKCLSNGYDLSEGMVYTGWAQPLESAPDYFKKLAREAKAKHRGMWRISAQ